MCVWLWTLRYVEDSLSSWNVDVSSVILMFVWLVQFVILLTHESHINVLQIESYEHLCDTQDVYTSSWSVRDTANSRITLISMCRESNHTNISVTLETCKFSQFVICTRLERHPDFRVICSVRNSADARTTRISVCREWNHTRISVWRSRRVHSVSSWDC